MVLVILNKEYNENSEDLSRESSRSTFERTNIGPAPQESERDVESYKNTPSSVLLVRFTEPTQPSSV